MTPSIILHVDDDPNDRLLVQMAIRRSALPIICMEACNGIEGINYLAGEEGFADRTKFPLPQLVLLDLKMPGKTGFEVLDWLQSRPNLLHIPTVVLTASDSFEDRSLALQKGAREFLVKQLSLGVLANCLAQFCNLQPDPVPH